MNVKQRGSKILGGLAKSAGVLAGFQTTSADRKSNDRANFVSDSRA